MKISILSHALVAPTNRQLWERFAELYPNSSVTVIVPHQWVTARYGAQISYISEPEVMPNYEVVPLHRIAGRFGYYSGLRNVLTLREPDVFYVGQELFDWSALIALGICKRVSSHPITIGGSTINIDYHLKLPHHRLKEYLAFRWSDCIIAMNSEAETLLRLHGYEKPVMIQHGIGCDEGFWKPSAQALPSQPFHIGFVGTLSPEKGVVDLLAACAKLRSAWQLSLIGDGPQREDLESQVAQLGLGERVVFVGYKPRQEIGKIIQTFHVLVLPSRTTLAWKEQFGLVLVEAMLSGIAVIGSNSGAIPEVIGDAGIIFPEGDVSALTQALQHLIDNAGYRRVLTEKGRRRALEKYSTTALAKQFYGFCEELLSR